MAIHNLMQGGSNPAKDCTATADKILEGYTAGVGKEVVEGTMPDNGDVSTAIQNGVLLEGFTSGGTIENLTAENIKKGITIAGKVGSYAGAAASGTFSGNGNTTITITHNLGRTPIMITGVATTYNKYQIEFFHWTKNSVASTSQFFYRQYNEYGKNLSVEITTTSSTITFTITGDGAFGYTTYQWVAY